MKPLPFALVVVPFWILSFAAWMAAYAVYEKVGADLARQREWQVGVVERCLPPSKMERRR